jgi:hypothetical protein
MDGCRPSASAGTPAVKIHHPSVCLSPDFAGARRTLLPAEAVGIKTEFGAAWRDGRVRLLVLVPTAQVTGGELLQFTLGCGVYEALAQLVCFVLRIWILDGGGCLSGLIRVVIGIDSRTVM